MKTFSTILFVEDSPVGYQVSQNDPDHITMNPAENPSRKIFPPVLSLSNIAGTWQVNGTLNKDLIAQVMDGLRYNMDFSPHHFTAAP